VKAFYIKMVRNIVGVLLEVGQKRRPVKSIEALFKAKNRREIGMPAPSSCALSSKSIY